MFEELKRRGNEVWEDDENWRHVMHDIFRISHILHRSEQKLIDETYRDSSRWILTNIKDMAL